MNHLWFIDDSLQIQKSSDEPQEKLNDQNREEKKNLNIVLKMNRNITKVMSTATFWKDKKRWRTGRDPRIQLLKTGEIREWAW